MRSLVRDVDIACTKWLICCKDKGEGERLWLKLGVDGAEYGGFVVTVDKGNVLIMWKN